jgi:hypothetical protein
MPITRTPIIDDSGTGMDGTVLNNAWKQELYNQIDAMGGVTNSPPVTTTGPITSLPLPAGGGDQVIYMTNASLTTIQGITPGIANQRATLVAAGTGQVNLAHLSGAAGSVAMRLFNFANSAPTPLASGGVATYVYDATVGGLWRMVDHEQGAWITPAYSAANFSAVGAMTWTVDAGDVVTLRYRLSGRTMQVSFQLNTTSVGGTLSNALYLLSGAWGGFSAAAQVSNRLAYVTDNGAVVQAFARLNGATVCQLHKGDIANWVASTNLTTLDGSITFDVN